MRSAPEISFDFGIPSDLDSRSRRNGTSQIMSEGQVKVCYGVFSKFGGLPYFLPLDRFLTPVGNGNVINAGQSYKGMYETTGNIASWASIADTISPSVSSSMTTQANYCNYTKSIGEFGLSAFDAYSNGAYATPATVDIVKHINSYQFIDSDHKDRSVVYIYDDVADCVRAIDRISHLPKLGLDPFNFVKTAGGAIPNLKQGGLSYNATRKELAAVSLDSTTLVTLKIWSGVDFDRYPSPAAALSAPGVTVTVWSITFGAIGILSSHAQAIKPVLVNDGTLYFSVQGTASTHSLYQLSPVRGGSGGSLTLYSSPATNSVNFASLYDSPKKMQSRDGSSVAIFSQYYYYGGGSVVFIIDKLKSLRYPVSQPDTSAGSSIVPFGDSGWLMTYGNSSSNGTPSTLNSNMVIYERWGSDGQLSQCVPGLRVKLPWLPYNNSNTDYPVLYQVADYALLNDQSVA